MITVIKDQLAFVNFKIFSIGIYRGVKNTTIWMRYTPYLTDDIF